MASAQPWAVFCIFLRLGLRSFGGPIAHLGYFHDEFVVRRAWLSEQRYADLVALCQFLPGPASSQVGMALGIFRAGYAGALAAWLGFTLPSALALMLFAESLSRYEGLSGALQGLKVLAVAVVAQAVWTMARSLCPDVTRVTLMTGAACVALWVPSVLGQLGVMALAGLLGWRFCQPSAIDEAEPLPVLISRRAGLWFLLLFWVLLLGVPLLVELWPNALLVLWDAFYRAGALVFGGGHVVLPLLQAEVVAPGWISDQRFLAGYSAAQAVPGPLFSFAAFLGMSIAGWLGGVLCLLAIFMPSFLLVAGVLPFWEALRRNQAMQSALCGVNAAVVGLLLAALYQPVWVSAIHHAQDAALALLAFVALVFWRLPLWGIVLGSALAGWWLSGMTTP